MRRLITWLGALMVAWSPAVTWASEGATAYSRGNAFIYFMAIGAVLIFGINDVFHKKWLTWASAIVIPVSLYLMLPEK
jgi:hypothetical protein